MNRRRGFTLVEVVVALAVLAVAFTAAYRALGQSTNNVELLKRRALASWVAQNQLALLQLDRSGLLPGSGQAEQAGLSFVWQVTLSATPNAAFRRAEITVSATDEPGYALARLGAYLGGPR